MCDVVVERIEEIDTLREYKGQHHLCDFNGVAPSKGHSLLARWLEKSRGIRE